MHHRSRIEIGAAHQYAAPIGVIRFQVQRDDLTALFGGYLVILTYCEKQPVLWVQAQPAVAEPGAFRRQGPGVLAIPEPYSFGEIVTPGHQTTRHSIGTPAIFHHPGTHVEPGGDLGNLALPPVPDSHSTILGSDSCQPEHPVLTGPDLTDAVGAHEGLINGHALHGHSL